MPDPLALLAILAAIVVGVSVLLARLIPDEYDGLELRSAPVRRRALRR